MPEYLAPGVYVEEIDTGSKPIEGVSTSTAGMVGVAERGPVNVPILVTSFGEYRRWFGELLNRELYGEHRYLPHGVEGFFTNGGKRVYVTRVLDPAAAAPATRQMVAPDAGAPTATQLALRTGSGANPIIVLDGTGLNATDTVQIGAGAGAEFQEIAAPLAAANVVTLNLPLAHAHANGQNVEAVTVADDDATTLAQAAAAGTSSITVTSAAAYNPALAPGEWLRIGATGVDDEYIQVDSIAGNNITLRAPLSLAHANTSDAVRQTVAPVAPTRQLAAAGASGESLLSVNNNAGFAVGNFVRIHHTDPARVEIRIIGQLSRVTLDHPLLGTAPAATRVEVLTLGVGTASGTMADAHRGDTVIEISDRSALSAGDLLQLASPNEIVEIAALPVPLPAPNPGRVVLRSGLRADHAATNAVTRFAAPAGIDEATAVAVDAAAESNAIVVGAGNLLAANDLLRLVTPGGSVSYYSVNGAPAALTPQSVNLVNALQLPQSAGAAVVVRAPMFEVRALDAGVWGNRLRVGMEPQPDALLNTQVRGLPPSNTSLRLMSAAGIESGTELVVTDAANNVTRHKVASIDRQNDYLITLEATPALPLSIAAGDRVRSQEYRFIVELLRQPDPANPARNNVAIDREVFTYLSLDPRHSRYFQRVIGTTWNMATTATTQDDDGNPLRRADRRSEGESGYVRVRDTAATTGLRAGPVAEYEQRPDGTRRLILLPLAHGDDVLGAVSDATYIGADNVDPELRTGLFTLRNVEDISIAAAPGRTRPQMQAAIINHCELMRYRFVVLDGAPPPADSMSNIQAQRQQFDTKYAALYHPWLLIPDPFPLSAGTVADYPIPPSGHVAGIYARTDIERGVHKAPANEVVRGITGLQRLLNKEQHDILNPFPVNINVIRDFRPNNRGIRVYGGRCITSDSDWKYVNVRRLMIFLEASIDRGLQWVVFEPNAEPLWARVRRSIVNFLTLVWRNGALEGTKPEEAFFVKCDRTTMTQTDIDSGRLICVVGVAPVKPAEFVIIRIGLWTAHADE